MANHNITLHNTHKRRNILLFDVDGTIAKSGQQIDPHIKDLIRKLSTYYDIGIVGGGTRDKVLRQLEDLYFNHYFFECGCVYYTNNFNDTSNLTCVKQSNIRTHEIYPKINILIKTALHFLANVEYTISGHFIDLRHGMVYISLIGMAATNEEREYFINLDKIHKYRHQLLDMLLAKSSELNIDSDTTICEGGAVGLSIFPIEYDKLQVLQHITHVYTNIHYFGDKHEKNGNDFKLLNCTRTIGHPVHNLDTTRTILANMLTSVSINTV